MRKLILSCGLSPGDIVMMTGAVRDLHRCYPGRFLTDVRTSCSELWEHNPHVTRLEAGQPGVERIECSYPLIDRCNEAPYHCLHGFVEFLNDRLELAIRPTRFHGDIHLSVEEKSWHSQVRELTGAPTPFWVVCAGGKYDVTIKWWDAARYQAVVDHFRGRIQFVQVGAYGHHHPRLDGVIDLRGQTDLRQLVRLVHHAQGVLCGVTALMHLAAAVEVRPGAPRHRPCVVVAGGREPPHWEAYPHHRFLHVNGALPCCASGGCWRDRVRPLRDGDPRDRRDRLCVDVRGGMPRCMDMIRAEDVIRAIETYYEGGMLTELGAEEVRAAEIGVRESRDNPYDGQPLTLSSAGMACERFIEERLPAVWDAGGHAGRGVVICGGGAKLFANAWVCIRMLRRAGCSLPVELWHLGGGEMDPAMEALVAPLGVRCVDASAVRRRHPARRLHGWELKPYAMLHSRFREVLYLDADNVPLVDPEFLFETAPYRRTGAIFWPDKGREARGARIWRSCGLRRPAGPEFESGQMVVDKGRCGRALRLALWFNEQSDFYYRHLHGDKETFHLAFRKLGQRFALVRTPVKGLSGAMCQHDFEGRRIFQHRTPTKWSLDGANRRVRGFWREQECLEQLEDLRRVWDGRVGERKSTCLHMGGGIEAVSSLP